MKHIHITVHPREGADPEKVLVMGLAHLGEGLIGEANYVSGRVGGMGKPVTRDLRAERAIEEDRQGEPLSEAEVESLLGDTAVGRFASEVESFIEERLEERGRAARDAL